MLKKADIIKKQLKEFYEDNFGKILEINEKYSSPKLTDSPTVKFALFALRIYLLFIASLIVYKVVTLIY